MPLQVNGTPAQRATIQTMLRQICWSMVVDPATGAATNSLPGPQPAGSFNSGSPCLQALTGPGRTVTIRPLAGPASAIPGPDGMTIGAMGGGATTRGAGAMGTPAAPGLGPDGFRGANSDVYIDMSNNGGAGYPHGFPLWLVLAHELTSGHAWQNFRGTAAATFWERENQAITSEREHVAEHNEVFGPPFMPLRPLFPPPVAPVPPPTNGGWFS